MDMAESVIMTSRSELPRIVNGAFFRKYVVQAVMRVLDRPE